MASNSTLLTRWDRLTKPHLLLVITIITNKNKDSLDRQTPDVSRTINSVLPVSSRTGDTGLEIRSYGAGSPFPVGVHDRLCGGDLRHYLPGTFALRYPRAYRSAVLRDQDCLQHLQAQPVDDHDAISCVKAMNAISTVVKMLHSDCYERL